MTYPDGSVYSGQWQRGLRHGHGRCEFSDKTIYDGQWANDMPNYKGCMTFPSGDTYEGAWVDGQRTGMGVLRKADETKYTGEFLQNVYHGSGKLSSREFVYKGGFALGQFEGNGEYHSTKERFVGGYKQGLKHGSGEQWLSDGTTYSGCFENGVYNGAGVLTTPEKAIFSGTFVDGELTTSNGMFKVHLSKVRQDSNAAVSSDFSTLLAEMVASKDKGRTRQKARHADFLCDYSDKLPNNWDVSLASLFTEQSVGRVVEYSGEFVGSKFHGQGIGTFSSGLVFQGLWNNNAVTKGYLYLPDDSRGHSTTTDALKHARFCCKSVYANYAPNDDTLLTVRYASFTLTQQGLFSRGLRTGKFIVTLNDTVFKGSFLKDAPSGDGSLSSSRPGFSFLYTGKFTDGLRTGVAFQRIDNLYEFRGIFTNDVFSEGVLTILQYPGLRNGCSLVLRCSFSHEDGRPICPIDANIVESDTGISVLSYKVTTYIPKKHEEHRTKAQIHSKLRAMEYYNTIFFNRHISQLENRATLRSLINVEALSPHSSPTQYPTYLSASNGRSSFISQSSFLSTSNNEADGSLLVDDLKVASLRNTPRLSLQALSKNGERVGVSVNASALEPLMTATNGTALNSLECLNVVSSAHRAVPARAGCVTESTNHTGTNTPERVADRLGFISFAKSFSAMHSGREPSMSLHNPFRANIATSAYDSPSTIKVPSRRSSARHRRHSQNADMPVEFSLSTLAADSDNQTAAHSLTSRAPVRPFHSNLSNTQKLTRVYLFEYSNGYSFIGGSSIIMPSGSGRLYYPSGAIYEGEVCGACPSGAGTLFHADNAFDTYFMDTISIEHGHFADGSLDGEHCKVLCNQVAYVGPMSQGRPHGTGKLYLLHHADSVSSVASIHPLQSNSLSTKTSLGAIARPPAVSTIHAQKHRDGHTSWVAIVGNFEHGKILGECQLNVTDLGSYRCQLRTKNATRKVSLSDNSPVCATLSAAAQREPLSVLQGLFEIFSVPVTAVFTCSVFLKFFALRLGLPSLSFVERPEPRNSSLEYLLEKLQSLRCEYSGNISGNLLLPHGSGTLTVTTPTGNILFHASGTFADGYLNGNGNLIIHEIARDKKTGLMQPQLRETYEGALAASVRNGHATQFVPLQDEHYVGTFCDNKRHGHGSLEWLTSGNRYVGGFADNVIVGTGVFHYGPSDPHKRARYEGSFVRGSPHDSNGKLAYSNGASYSGAVADGVPEGFGVLRFNSSLYYKSMLSQSCVNTAEELNAQYTGYLRCNAMSGKGELHISGLRGRFMKLSGMFADNYLTDNKGVVSTEKFVYTGCVLRSVISGYGEISYQTGIKYIGFFRDGLPEGLGTINIPIRTALMHSRSTDAHRFIPPGTSNSALEDFFTVTGIFVNGNVDGLAEFNFVLMKNWSVVQLYLQHLLKNKGLPMFEVNSQAVNYIKSYSGRLRVDVQTLAGLQMQPLVGAFVAARSFYTDILGVSMTDPNTARIEYSNGDIYIGPCTDGARNTGPGSPIGCYLISQSNTLVKGAFHLDLLHHQTSIYTGDGIVIHGEYEDGVPNGLFRIRNNATGTRIVREYSLGLPALTCSITFSKTRVQYTGPYESGLYFGTARVSDTTSRLAYLLPEHGPPAGACVEFDVTFRIADLPAHFKRLLPTADSLRGDFFKGFLCADGPLKYPRLLVSVERLANCQSYTGYDAYDRFEREFGAEVTIIMGKAEHGQCRAALPGGSEYDGALDMGVFHGRGRLINAANKTFYEGDFLSGVITGKGAMYYNKSLTKWYKGEFVDGERTGQGTMRYQDGSLYKGGFAGDKKNGYGELTPSVGALYKGEWENNALSGYGLLISENGNKYEGHFRKNAKCGHGKLTKPNGDVYEGEFVNGALLDDHATIHFSNGDSYEGCVVSDIMSGQGVLQYVNGDIYRGAFQADQPHGEGVMAYASGDVYTGSFVNGRPAGSGHMRYVDGREFRGHWQ